MARFNPYEAYLNTDAATTDQLRLIVLMYDAAIRYLREAIGCFERKDRGQAGSAMEKARATIGELRATLNPEKGGEIAQNLSRIYNFVNREILLSGAENNPARLEGLIAILNNVREGWQGIAKNGDGKRLTAAAAERM